MIRNQGGNMVLDMIILGLIVATLVVIFWVKGYSEKPSKVSLSNEASIRDMSGHLNEHDEAIKSIEGKLDELDTGLEEIDNFAKANKAEIDTVKEARGKIEDRIERLEAVVAELSERVQSVPREMSFKIQALKESIPMEIQNAKFISKSWIDYERREVTGRNGKRIERMVPVRKQYMKSIHPKTKRSKFNMPGVREAKDQIVEAGL